MTPTAIRLADRNAGVGSLFWRVLNSDPHNLGLGRPLVPYMGNKYDLAPSVLAALTDAVGGSWPCPVAGYWLCEINPWLTTWRALLTQPSQVAAFVARWQREDPRGLYRKLLETPRPHPSNEPILYAAQHLFLLRLTYGCRPVDASGSHWVTEGFAESNAYGRAKTLTAGALKPLVPNLARRLAIWSKAVASGLPFPISVVDGSNPINLPCGPDVVKYFDPTYGTTSYPVDMTVGKAIAIALARRQNVGAAGISCDQGLSRFGAVPTVLKSNPRSDRQMRGRFRREILNIWSSNA